MIPATAMISATASAHQPSPGAYLDDLLASRFLPKQRIGRIRSAGELPGRLRGCTENLRAGSEWRAYGNDEEVFFAIARLHTMAPCEEPGTAIDAYFLDASAVVYAAGVWEYSAKTGWWLDAVLNVSYDSDYGWWLDAVMESKSAAGRGVARLAPGPVEVRRLSPPRAQESSCVRRAARARKARS